MPTTKITTQEIRVLLRERYSDQMRYSVAEEVGNACGIRQERRLDMVIVDNYKGSTSGIHGFEIKVSKADLRKELQDSSKHNIFFPSLDYFSLVAPKEIVDESLIPKSWGLYYVKCDPDGEARIYTRRKPLSLHDGPKDTIPKDFAISLMRCLSNQSPSQAQLEKVQKDARKHALLELHYDPTYMRAKQNEEKLKAYEELEKRFRLWRPEDVERAMDEFEHFVRYNPKELLRLIDRARRDIECLEEFAKEQLVEKGDER